MKDISTTNRDFFKVGGSLAPGAPSYVVRQADGEMMQAVLAGEYCKVLTARQMGKSSLMVRTVCRLQEEGVRTVTIDLTGLGTKLDASEWYFGLISRFERQLDLSVDVGTWWEERDQLGPVQRFSDFLRQVVLEEVQDPIVVFIDEIDSTLNLPFTDDFFAAIRAAYNARASDPTYERITFVLLGVARPSDMVKDRTRTPYNIGTSIDLTDFTPEEAQVLLTGLEDAHPDQAEGILERVLHWTGGHPYLTQKTCAELVSQEDHWTDEGVDRLVRQLFLAEEARKETNLQFIRDQIRESDERAGMLRVYRQVWAGKQVEDEERSVAKSRLKLTGLVKTTTDGFLSVRNRIYERIFDRQWVRENVMISPMQRLAIVMVGVAFLALIMVGYLIYRQQTMPSEVRAELYRENFASATSPEVQINDLAGLFGLEGYEDEALDLFFELNPDQQQAMFEGLDIPQQVGEDVLTVVESVYQDPRLENTAEGNHLLRAMADVLHQVEKHVRGAEATAMEIDYWMTGRERVAQGDYAPAVDQYTLALGLNDENVSILLDRARAYAVLGEYENTLADLQEVLELNLEREETIQQMIEENPRLFTYVGKHRQDYQKIAAWVPTLTPIVTPTNTPTPIRKTSTPFAIPSEGQAPSPVTDATSTVPSTPGAGRVDADVLYRDKDGMAMVYVPTGTFLMGSTDIGIDKALAQCEEYLGDENCQRSWFENESPQHSVTLDGFWIDETEVTNFQYALCVADNKCKELFYKDILYICVTDDWCEELSVMEGELYEGKNHPVMGVSWYDAVDYCTWAGARLPTEAEWEYAARGTDGNVFPWGNYRPLPGKPPALLNYCDSSCELDWADQKNNDGHATNAQVGSFPMGASWCHAQDMAGNVWEWVNDWYDAYPSAVQTNPIGPATGKYKVLRGGSWDDIQPYARTTNRFPYPPNEHYISAGFRCVMSSLQGE